MTFHTEVDNEGNTVRNYTVDEYGNEEVYFDTLGTDANFNVFEAIASRIKLEISINKELYDNGKISKELYEKIENILLDRIKPFSKYSKA